MKKKVGIFGGTFDPIHIGHIITTRYVLEKRNLDKIIFIPCNISPLKIDVDSTLPQHRLNMLKLAIEGLPHFDYSEFEINKGEISYTVDTLIELRKKYDEIELIIGYDNLIVFDKWHKPDQIFDLAKVVVMKRNADVHVKSNHIYFDEAIILDTPTIEISSTDIRDRIKKGLSIDYLVPQKIKEYIVDNGLYK